jgi:proteasome lid subunit RPN8/RPN11
LSLSAEKARPNEDSGFLLGLEAGADFIISDLIPVKNEFSGPESYRLTAQELLAAENEASGKSLLVLGFFHSHPGGQEAPSRTDHLEALPFYIYAVTVFLGDNLWQTGFYCLDESTGLLSACQVTELS